MRRTGTTRAALLAAALLACGGPAVAAEWTLAPETPPMLTYGIPGDGDSVLFSAMCPVGTGPYELSVHAAVETIPGITVAADGTRNALDSAKVVFEVGGKSFTYDGAAVQPDDINGGLEVDVQIAGSDPFMTALGSGESLKVVLAGRPAGTIPLGGIKKPLGEFMRKCGQG
jgi:hypothetical protein